MHFRFNGLEHTLCKQSWSVWQGEGISTMSNKKKTLLQTSDSIVSICYYKKEFENGVKK